MSTQKRTRLFAGLTTAAVISGCLGFGGGEFMLPDLLVSAAASRQLQMGDVNFNGYIEADDSSKILHHYLALMLEVPYNRLDSLQQVLADVDHNSVIDADDATMVLQEYVCDLTGTSSEWEIYSETYPVGRDPNATTTTDPVPAETFIVNGVSLPVHTSVDKLTARKGQPTAVLTEEHLQYTLEYLVYADTPKDTVIGIASDDQIIGYYAVTRSYENLSSLGLTDYQDAHQNHILYAVLALDTDYSVSVFDIKNTSDLTVFCKLNYYATNGMRGLHGLEPLKWCDKAAKSATGHSREMAEKEYFAHESYDGTEFWKRLMNDGVPVGSAAENIAAGYFDPFIAADGWYNSFSGHRENILSPDLNNLGVGFAYHSASDYWVYGTQDFYG